MNKNTLARQVGNYFLRLCYVPRMKNVYKDPKGKHHVIGKKPSTYGFMKPVHNKLGLQFMDKNEDRMRHIKDWKEFKRYFSKDTKVGKKNKRDIIRGFQDVFDRNKNLKHPVE